MPLSDAEIVCAWMEPRPTHKPDFLDVKTTKWWKFVGFPDWRPKIGDDWGVQPSLDACHEVEERLMSEQAWSGAAPGIGAIARIAQRVAPYDYAMKALPYPWHATAEQKVKALAAVLRSIVERKYE